MSGFFEEGEIRRLVLSNAVRNNVYVDVYQEKPEIAKTGSYDYAKQCCGIEEVADANGHPVHYNMWINRKHKTTKEIDTVVYAKVLASAVQEVQFFTEQHADALNTEQNP